MSELFFQSSKHKQRFVEIIERIDRGDDCEYVSALYILTSDLLNWQTLEQYVSHDSIKFSAMLNMPLSTSEDVFLRVAANLFNGSEHVDPVEFVSLDEKNFRVVVQAMELRRKLGWSFSLKEAERS